MIVDDEMWVKKSLLKQIKWEIMGLQLIGEASDGDEAYQLANLLQPDIIITDVKMPGMNGIELSRILLQSMPNVKFIIISGFSEFDLVKQAMINKAIDYILKPIDEIELNEALQKGIQEINNERNRMEQEDKVSLINRYLPLFKERCLNDILSKPEMDENEGHKILKTLKAHFIEKRFYIVLLKNHGNKILLDQLENVLMNINLSVVESVCFHNNHSEDEFTVILGNPDCTEIEQYRINTIIHHIKKELELLTSGTLIIGIGRCYSGWKNLSRSYREAAYALRIGNNDRSNPICFYNERCEKREKNVMVSEIITHIKNSYNQVITLENAAEKFHLNSSYLSRLFKQETGENFVVYLTKTRIDKARELIGNTNTSIQEIAIMVGFENSNYFSKLFKRYMGISPGEYKKTSWSKW
jgi:two-component system response regulator YesN